ncbi:NACAD protein, partial [Glaucidium brasilianum]|nr:NACAD protein [Glaucidium brasilianum]
ADPLDTRIVMGEETCSPTAPERGGGGGPPSAVPCPFPAPTKDPPHRQAAEPTPGRPPAPSLDPDLFFTAPSTPIRVGGSRLLPPPAEEQTDGESEGLCSPPTSPSGSYMTAEGGSWGSSGTASTSPSCSPNLVAEAEAMAVAEAEGSGMAEAMAVLPTCLEDVPAFTPPSPEEEEEGLFALPGDDDEEDGETPEEEEDEEWEVSVGEGLPGGGLIPAALLPFRGSLLFQAEAVEITPLPPGAAPLPLSDEEEEEEDDEEEEEEGGSTSASFLRSLSETSITEGVDESFAFRDDTSASSDSAAYDGEEDERLYGTEGHAVGAEGRPPPTAAASPGADASVNSGIELHLHAGMAPARSPSPEGSPQHQLLDPVPGGCPPPEPPHVPEELTMMPGTEEELVAKDDLGEGPGVELVASDSVLQSPGLCSREPRDPQTDGLGANDLAPANGEPQGGPGSDNDDDGDGTVRAGSTEPAATDGHDEPDAVATDLLPSVAPSPPDTVATDLLPSVT